MIVMVKLTEKIVLARSRANDLVGVKTLNCWGNELTDITVLENVPNIEVINASANKIETLQALVACSKLKELYLRKNKISNISEITHLKELKNLKLLWLSGNPFCENLSDEQYRLTIVKTLPQLQKLDNITISSSELQKALESDLQLNEPEVCKENDESVHKEPTDKLNEEPLIEKINAENTTEDTDLPSHTVGGGGDITTTELESAVQMSLDETNQLRAQLGFKPIPAAKFGSSASKLTKPSRKRDNFKASRNNILTATLALVEELDEESLLILQDSVQEHLDCFQETTNEVRREKQVEILPT